MLRFQIFIILSFLSLQIFAQTKRDVSQSSSQAIKLYNADSLVRVRKDVDQYEGHVKFQHGNVTGTCDKAIHYSEENRAVFTGHVVFRQEDMELTAPRIEYYGNSGLAKASEGVKIKDKNGTLSAKIGSYSTQSLIADFEGNVVVSDNVVKIYADTVQYHRKPKISYGYGNVKVTDDSVTIVADTLEYQHIPRMTYASGSVVIEDDSALIFANKIEHNRNTRDSKAYLNVCIKGKYKGNILTADTLISINSEKYAIAIGSPVLYQIDTVKEKKQHLKDTLKEAIKQQDSTQKDSLQKNSDFQFDTLSVASDSMEVFRLNKEKYVFKKNVEIRRGNIFSVANNATFYNSEEYIELTGTPIVWYDSTQLYGENIIIKIPNKKLKAIVAYFNALTAARDDSLNPNRINQISGDEIYISIENQAIAGISAYKNTKSLYYNITDNEPDGVKRDAADSILITISENKIETIDWRGVVAGNMIPENVIAGKNNDYYLPNFRWTDTKPKKRVFTPILSNKRWK